MNNIERFKRNLVRILNVHNALEITLHVDVTNVPEITIRRRLDDVEAGLILKLISESEWENEDGSKNLRSGTASGI